MSRALPFNRRAGESKEADYQVTLTRTPIAPFPGTHGLTKLSPVANAFIFEREPLAAGALGLEEGAVDSP